MWYSIGKWKGWLTWEIMSRILMIHVSLCVSIWNRTDHNLLHLFGVCLWNKEEDVIFTELKRKAWQIFVNMQKESESRDLVLLDRRNVYVILTDMYYGIYTFCLVCFSKRKENATWIDWMDFNSIICSYPYQLDNKILSK